MSAIHAIGSNGSGQLGIGHKEDVSVPKAAVFPAAAPYPINIQAGGNHTVILSSEGTLYCAGDYTTGACGLTPEDAKESTFNDFKSGLDSDTLITHIAAMWESTVVVMTDERMMLGPSDRVYSFGTGHKGELGLGDMIFRSSQAQLIENFPPTGRSVMNIAASVSHVVVVLDNGEVYGWGNGRKGQLGQPAEIVHRPRKIEGLSFRVERVACGREFTFLVGSSGDRDCTILGSDKYNVISNMAVQRMQDYRQITASWGSIFCLKRDGTVVCWGRSDHGQLPPADLPKLDSMAVGSEHVLGLTKAGDVVAWGWGEHGNCGPGTDADGDVKGRWNTVASTKFLPPGSKISSIGSGCATSWIAISGMKDAC